ncbi:hypothetical protein [Streptomyces sp. CB03238]|uniref:hypothetical protein n=1 Tax=Streptomyces sp. CB03238 TaxID=1907777 RepID=UPI0015C499DD|nr:hypothetical protein [Streptomyces sp. CB03238]
MQAKETVFAGLVQGWTQQLQVPLHQRTYSWTHVHLTRLWNDVLDQAEVPESGRPAGTGAKAANLRARGGRLALG